LKKIKRKEKKKGSKKAWKSDVKNTSVFATGLPKDATFDEIVEIFTRGGGVIKKDAETGALKVKMYKDETGEFKGEVVVTYFMDISVPQAIKLLDERDIRGDGTLMRVTEAKFEPKADFVPNKKSKKKRFKN